MWPPGPSIIHVTPFPPSFVYSCCVPLCVLCTPQCVRFVPMPCASSCLCECVCAPSMPYLCPVVVPAGTGFCPTLGDIVSSFGQAGQYRHGWARPLACRACKTLSQRLMSCCATPYYVMFVCLLFCVVLCFLYYAVPLWHCAFDRHISITQADSEQRTAHNT
jgi:hypothetical protein